MCFLAKQLLHDFIFDQHEGKWDMQETVYKFYNRSLSSYVLENNKMKMRHCAYGTSGCTYSMFISPHCDVLMRYFCNVLLYCATFRYSYRTALLCSGLKRVCARDNTSGNSNNRTLHAVLFFHLAPSSIHSLMLWH